MATGKTLSKQRNTERRARIQLPKPKGEVLGASTSAPSGSLTDLSIALAKQNENAKLAPKSGAGSITDLSIGLAKGNEITQEDIGRAQAGGASLASLTSPATASRTTSPTTASSATQSRSNQTGVGGGRYSRYGLSNENEGSPLVAEPDYEQIQRQFMRDAQKEVNSLYKYRDSLLKEQQGVNEENLREVSSVNTLTGLAGSTEANRTTQVQQGQNQQANKKIQNEINVQVQSILQKVRTDALAQYNQAKTDYRADVRLGMEMDDESRKKSSENVAMLSASGVTFDGYKQTDPEAYEAMAANVGGEEVLKAMFTLNRPQEQILDKKIEGGKYVIAYQNPLDGKTRVETLDLGLPPQYTKTIDAGDRLLAIPDGWTGDPAELITINKGLTPSRADSGNGSGSQGIYDVLDFRTANSVISQADKFTSSDIVKRFNNVQDSRNNIALIDANTQNPADHQAIVYYFAKALDPESVVREGEYETIKKYAQNIFGRYKGEINNAINGSGFLSQNAIQNIKDTIENRYNSGLVQYQNKQKETARVINTIAGQDVAGMVLTDYAGGAIGNEGQSVDGMDDDAAYQEYLKATNGS